MQFTGVFTQSVNLSAIARAFSQYIVKFTNSATISEVIVTLLVHSTGY